MLRGVSVGWSRFVSARSGGRSMSKRARKVAFADEVQVEDDKRRREDDEGDALEEEEEEAESGDEKSKARSECAPIRTPSSRV